VIRGEVGVEVIAADVQVAVGVESCRGELLEDRFADRKTAPLGGVEDLVHEANCDVLVKAGG
jgi:hypothetical protein